MAEVGGDLWTSSSPNHCSYQDHLELVFQGFSYQVSNITKDGATITFPGNLVQCLTTTTVKFLHTLKWSFLYFSLCLMLLVLPLGATGESLLLSSLHSPIMCSYLTAWHALFCNLGWHQPIQKEE